MKTIVFVLIIALTSSNQIENSTRIDESFSKLVQSAAKVLSAVAIKPSSLGETERVKRIFKIMKNAISLFTATKNIKEECEQIILVTADDLETLVSLILDKDYSKKLMRTLFTLIYDLNGIIDECK